MRPASRPFRRCRAWTGTLLPETSTAFATPVLHWRHSNCADRLSRPGERGFAHLRGLALNFVELAAAGPDHIGRSLTSVGGDSVVLLGDPSYQRICPVSVELAEHVRLDHALAIDEHCHRESAGV
jgi:hypothetical protein